MQKLLPSIVLATMLATSMAGCVLVDGTSLIEPTTATGAQPVIQAFDYSPKSGVGKNDAIVFTLVATDPAGKPLSYTWSSTKGTLSATTGQTVSWRPIKADGTSETGLTQVTVVVSNGSHVSTATVNIQINAQGEAVVNDVVKPSPAPVASGQPSASPVPTSAPSATPSATPTTAPFDPSFIYFIDGFEDGLDNWNLGSELEGEGANPLSWKVTYRTAQEGKAAAILSDDEDEVKADVEQEQIWLSSTTMVDLSEAKMPRIKLQTRNGATPPESVTYQIMLSSGSGSTDFGGNAVGDLFKSETFHGAKDWSAKDLDLSLAKGKVGYLNVAVTVKGNGTTFTGPMIDDVIVYDASK